MNVGNYYKQGLTSIPSGVYEEELNILHLYKNNLGDASSLRMPENTDFLIDLSNNKLRKTPDNISSLNKLLFLDLSDNLITKLPKDIGLMSELKQLTINNNPLLTLPESICEMKNLKWLWASDCHLRDIPESVCETLAENKVEVHIDGNRFPYTYAPGSQLYFLNDRYISVNNKIIQTKDYNEKEHQSNIKKLTRQILEKNGLQLKKDDNIIIALIKLIKNNVNKTELYNILRVQDFAQKMEILPRIIECNNFELHDQQRLKKILSDTLEENSINITVKRLFKKEKYKVYL